MASTDIFMVGQGTKYLFRIFIKISISLGFVELKYTNSLERKETEVNISGVIPV